MTEHEAATLAQRLTRIWEPIAPFTYRLHVEGAFPDVWLLTTKIAPNYEIEVETRDAECPERPFFVLNQLYERNGRAKKFCLICTNHRRDSESTTVHVYAIDSAERQLAEEWIPLFRRNCWLSGCPMEASAHEKAEWMQGFTREEVEAWGLRM